MMNCQGLARPWYGLFRLLANFNSISKPNSYHMFLVLLTFTLFFGGPSVTFFDFSVQANQAKNNFPVNRPARVQKNGQGIYLLSAAKGKAIGPDIKFMPEYQAFGWFTAKDRVEWEVDIQKEGDYQVEIEYSVDNAEAGKEFVLSSPHAQLVSKVLPSGSWETYKTLKPGKIHLKQGIQKIIFKSKTQFKEGAVLDLRAVILK
ncbi:carbohydrate-binding protein [Aquirufa sp. Wall-65K1]